VGREIAARVNPWPTAMARMKRDGTMAQPTTTRTAQIIGLGTHRFGLSHPIIRDVTRYWDGLRQGRLLPARSDVRPTAIMGALGHTFMLERSTAGHVRLRLAGAHLHEVMGMEVRGMPLRAFFALEERAALMAQMGTMFDTPHALALGLRAEPCGGTRDAPLTGQMVILPLTDRDGTANRAIGVLVTEGRIGLTPRRFTIALCHAVPIARGRCLGTMADPLPLDGQIAAIPPIPGQPVLTLIKGGRG